MNSKRRHVALILGPLVALLAVVLAGPAAARPLHANGQITFNLIDPVIDDNVVYIVNSDGSGLHRAISGPATYGDDPRWSPDARRIAEVGPSLANGDPPAATIIDVASGNYIQFGLADPTILTACYVWSPDGLRLACEGWNDGDPSKNGIYSIRVSDGRGLTRMTTNPSGGGHDVPGAYSPDGNRLVFSRSVPESDDFIGLFVVNVNGTGLRQITPPGTIVSTWEPQWSPQGNWIVFAKRIHPGDRSTMWLVRSSGADLHQLAPNLDCGRPIDDPTSITCTHPHFSPDGTKVVFRRVDVATGVTGIYSINLDGTDLQLVESQGSDGDESNPDWGVAQ